MSSFIGQGAEIDVRHSRFDIGSTDTVTGGGTGLPNRPRQAMHAASEVDEDWPFVTFTEPQSFKSEFADQGIGCMLLPDPKRDHRDFSWIKAGTDGLMPLAWRHSRFGPRHRHESRSFDRLHDVHAPVAA